MTEPAAPPPAPVPPLTRSALAGVVAAAPTAAVLAVGSLTADPAIRDAVLGVLGQGPTVAVCAIVGVALYRHHVAELAEERAAHARTRDRLDRIQDALIAPDLHRSDERGPP